MVKSDGKYVSIYENKKNFSIAFAANYQG